jgi:O-antigen/teichoic acid export membrane protein
MIGKIKRLFLERNILSLSGNLVFAALGFVSFLILARSMSQADFGSFCLYLTAATFIDLFRFGLTRSAIVRYLAGAKGEERLHFLGSNTLIGLVLIAILSVIIYATLWIGYDAIEESGFIHFFIWYPVLAIANLSWNNAVSHMQSYQGFGRIMVIRVMNVVIFLGFLILNKIFWQYGITAIIIANIVANLIPSIWSFANKWDGGIYLFKAKKYATNKILNFGKFSVGTMIGSSLLRSADTVIIGLAPILGPVGVAQYVIPLKLTEVIEIPLRSFMATAFPKLSKASIEKRFKDWKNIFNTYTGAISLIYIPFTLFLFIFAKEIVLILGGDTYKENIETLTIIARIFAIYGLLLPLDRTTGVALDSLEMPKKNFHKVIFMASANIIGDLIAVFVFESIVLVAVVTIINTLIGMLMGYYYLHQKTPIQFASIYKNGLNFYIDLYKKYKSGKGLV